VRHPNILSFKDSWYANGEFVFVTELMNSGTLREYMKKLGKQPNMKIIKNWTRQILKGLLYLHSHHPPIIHRDIKCDNIFINGAHGEVKIGDMGTAKMKIGKKYTVIGTPEFMAPEMYEEKGYSEKVDVYAFGMCLLELVTGEYPYSECKNAAQIYKKVSSGAKPDCLQKVEDEEIKSLISACIAPESERPAVKEIFEHSFFMYEPDVLLLSVDELRFMLTIQVTFRHDKNRMCVKFDYDLTHDTPEEVVNEMIQENVLPECNKSFVVNEIYRIVREFHIKFPFAMERMQRSAATSVSASSSTSSLEKHHSVQQESSSNGGVVAAMEGSGELMSSSAEKKNVVRHYHHRQNSGSHPGTLYDDNGAAVLERSTSSPFPSNLSWKRDSQYRQEVIRTRQEMEDSRRVMEEATQRALDAEHRMKDLEICLRKEQERQQTLDQQNHVLMKEVVSLREQRHIVQDTNSGSSGSNNFIGGNEISNSGGYSLSVPQSTTPVHTNLQAAHLASLSQQQQQPSMVQGHYSNSNGNIGLAQPAPHYQSSGNYAHPVIYSLVNPQGQQHSHSQVQQPSSQSHFHSNLIASNNQNHPMSTSSQSSGQQPQSQQAQGSYTAVPLNQGIQAQMNQGIHSVNQTMSSNHKQSLNVPLGSGTGAPPQGHQSHHSIAGISYLGPLDASPYMTNQGVLMMSPPQTHLSYHPSNASSHLSGMTYNTGASNVSQLQQQHQQSHSNSLPVPHPQQQPQSIMSLPQFYATRSSAAAYHTSPPMDALSLSYIDDNTTTSGTNQGTPALSSLASPLSDSAPPSGTSTTAPPSNTIPSYTAANPTLPSSAYYYVDMPIEDFVYDVALLNHKTTDKAAQWITKLRAQDIQSLSDLKELHEEDWANLGLTVFASRALKNALSSALSSSNAPPPPNLHVSGSHGLFPTTSPNNTTTASSTNPLPTSSGSTTSTARSTIQSSQPSASQSQLNSPPAHSNPISSLSSTNTATAANSATNAHPSSSSTSLHPPAPSDKSSAPY
jgi:serine/threonine protein kinase